MTITLELTKLTLEKDTKEITLCVGDPIVYYGISYRSFNTPLYGEINKDKFGYYIKWDDGTEDTRIDGSKYSNNILKYCGWI